MIFQNASSVANQRDSVNFESAYELTRELTKDNIYTRMMDLAHQALLSQKGLDLLILVLDCHDGGSYQPTYEIFETIMNVVRKNQIGRTIIMLKKAMTLNFLREKLKDFNLDLDFYALYPDEVYRVTTLQNLTWPIIRHTDEIYNFEGQTLHSITLPWLPHFHVGQCDPQVNSIF